MRIVVRNTDNVITMYSNGYPEPGDGCRLVNLSDVQWAECDRLLTQPNGGVTFDGNTFSALPPPPPPLPLTAQQKLEAAGLTVNELKQLLGLA